MSPVTLVVVYLLKQEHTSNTKKYEVFYRLIYHVHSFDANGFFSYNIVEEKKNDYE